MSQSLSKLYLQKYRKEWESNPEFKGWLKPFIGDDTRAYCLYCKGDFYKKLLKLFLLSTFSNRDISDLLSSGFTLMVSSFDP